MSTMIRHPQRLARIAGVFYLIIIACAMFAYLYVRGHVIVPGDMARTGANLVAHEQLYRMGFASAVIVVVSNPPMGVILCLLLQVVNRPIALLALVFITISTTIEAVNSFNYITPLFTFTLPEYHSAFNPHQIEALARGPIRLFGYAFSVSLTFFGVFCALIGYLITRSKFLPAILGVLMIGAGVCYWIDSFGLFLSWPDVPYILLFTFAAENLLALWLIIFGVNEKKWFEQAGLDAPVAR